MFDKGDVKRLLRSRSFRFARECREPMVDGRLSSYRWNGNAIHFRPGTSDPGLIYNILLKRGRKSEYWVPEALAPEVVLDIGGNIGISAIYFAARFPGARIFAFEPAPANLALLEQNVSEYDNVRVVPYALGRADGRATMHPDRDARNLGGFSLHRQGIAGQDGFEVEVRNVNASLAGLGLTRIDLVKIDTEGAEHEILTSLSEDMLGNVKWITGELHGERDFELLAYLSRWFDIEVRKGLRNRLFHFHACNKTLARDISLDSRDGLLSKAWRRARRLVRSVSSSGVPPFPNAHG